MPFKIVGADENGLFPTRVMTALQNRFTQKSEAALSTRAAKLRALGAQFYPALQTLTEVPTLSWSTASTLSRTISPMSSGEISLLGKPGVWNNSSWKYEINGKYVGTDFIFDGQNLEIGFIEQVSNGSKIWVFVDGAPVTLTESLGIATTAGTGYWLKLVFPTFGRRRITVHLDGINAFTGLKVDFTGSVTAAQPLPKVAFVGDSFLDGSAGATKFQSLAFVLTRLFNVNGFNGGIGGTGYVSGGGVSQPFGDTNRVSDLVAFNPDLIIIIGSVNDDPSQSSVQAAASSLFTTYRNSLPNTPIIVFGPQPTSAAGTLGSTRALNNAAVRTAANAASNVVAFSDMIGHSLGTVPNAFTTGSAWTTGQLTAYQGSIYEYVTGAQANMGPATPDTYPHWIPRTYAYTGTGQIGSLASNGTRDRFLYSDGTHPTKDGAYALAVRIAKEVRTILLTA